MTEIATRLSWKVLPEPILKEWFNLDLKFTFGEGVKLRRGHIPQEMDDRWFVFYENEWLYFCRSWTGSCTYGVHLTIEPDGVTASDCWASRDPDQFSKRIIDEDEALLREILSFVLETDE